MDIHSDWLDSHWIHEGSYPHSSLKQQARRKDQIKP